MAVTAGQSPGPFAGGTADGPPDQLWHRGWSPFATAAAGPPYNPAFITINFIEP